MPEGHTIHRLARRHARLLGGQHVSADSPQGRFEDGASLLDGRVLGATDAWGKHLFHRYDDLWLHVHLGLYGKFRDGTLPAPAARGALRLRLVGGGHWLELRGPTACEVLTDAERKVVLARLGPDPLRRRPDAEAFVVRVLRSRAPVATLLMDQSVVAGVGNVYRAEVLFRHRIHPLRPGNTLRSSQWRAMWADLVELMAEGVRTGRIDTVRPEHTPEAMGRAPRKDDHGGEVYVYRRTSLPCLVCGTTVRTGELAGRNSFWCPKCQPKFRSRALRSPTKGTGRAGGARA